MGKYTTHKNSHETTCACRIFYILTSEDIDDVISISMQTLSLSTVCNKKKITPLMVALRYEFHFLVSRTICFTHCTCL